MDHERVNPCQTNVSKNQQYDSVGGMHLPNGNSFNTPERCSKSHVPVPMTPDVLVPETPERSTSVECNSFGTMPPNLDHERVEPGQIKFSQNQESDSVYGKRHPCETSVDGFNQGDKSALSDKIEFHHASSSGSRHREKINLFTYM